ncbi:hypothetical protein BC629DRAFT_1596841 [Irpex lacteus]|nr:hypothetical protein BC629DRAFT_1596841 [Irpex lacteus]
MLQDSPQFHELYLSSCSDLVEVVSEVTDSKANRPLMQDSTHPDGPLAPANSELVEVVSEETESEAVRMLAARIPPELFEDILFYVNVDRVSQRPNWNPEGDALERNRGEPSPEDILIDLKRCSLVCLFWANRCREHIFQDKTLEINCYEDAEIFRRYIVQGCPRLTQVHQLIKRVEVTQNYSGILAPRDSERQTSFLHLIHLPVIQDKLDRLNIAGPVPEGFNPAKLDTPHWGIPPYTVVPSSFLPNRVFLTNVQFPSFYHIIKYIRHFCHATFVRFEKITWEGQMTLALPHVSSTITCQRRPRSLAIVTYGVCTDAVHLALTAVMMNPNCLLHRLSDEERMWMIKFTTLLWGDEKDPRVDIEFDVSEQATTMYMEPFHFVFEEAPATDRPDSVLSVVGIYAYLNGYGLRAIPANFDAMVSHARTHPTIRALVVLSDSSYRLQKFTKPFVEVLALAAQTIELVLAYEDDSEEERRAVGVDLVTLEPNGRIDTWDDEESKDYWGTHLSLQMLQRQLKKKRWISVH